MSTLSAPCKCATCGDPMAAGEAFRWYEKSGIRGGSRAAGRPSRWLPAHVNVDDCLRGRRAEADKMQRAIDAKTAELMAMAQAGATPEQLLAALSL